MPLVRAAAELRYQERNGAETLAGRKTRGRQSGVTRHWVVSVRGHARTFGNSHFLAFSGLQFCSAVVVRALSSTFWGTRLLDMISIHRPLQHHHTLQLHFQSSQHKTLLNPVFSHDRHLISTALRSLHPSRTGAPTHPHCPQSVGTRPWCRR